VIARATPWPGDKNYYASAFIWLISSGKHCKENGDDWSENGKNRRNISGVLTSHLSVVMLLLQCVK